MGELARDEKGCRGFQRLLERLENYLEVPGTVELLDELLEDKQQFYQLCNDKFGHHVAEAMLKHCRHYSIAGITWQTTIIEILKAKLDVEKPRPDDYVWYVME